MRRKPKRTYLGIQGLVGHTETPDYGFLFDQSTTKPTGWELGDSVVLPDGREFVFCKSAGACSVGRGNVFNNAIPATGIDYALLAAAAAKGDTSVQMTAVLTHTADDLQGGHIVLKPASGSTDHELQQRMVVGNTAAAIGGTVTIYLDTPLTEALTTASYGFVMPSPYSAIKYSEGSDAYNKSHIGISAVEVTASGVYHWEQYAGRCWLAPQGEGGTTDHGREVVWRYDGSIQLRDYSSALGGAYGQVAGYILDDNGLANGATEIMLTGRL